MIIYTSTKKGFLQDAANGIEDIIRSNVKEKFFTDIKPESGEYNAWKNSLGNAMYHVMNTDLIPDDAGVAIEYVIPRTRNRIDFVVTGEDANGRETVIIIELKQWSDVGMLDKDAMVSVRFKSGESEELHPSYQAWSYSTLLMSFNETVYSENIDLEPCAYLHNHIDDNTIKNTFFSDYLTKAPVFCKGEKEKLQEFIARYVKRGDQKNTIYRIENGRIRPSKHLAESLVSMIKGNTEFVMIDDQKIIYEEALALVGKVSDTQKYVLIVEGGPGTGKSVVAVNLLVALTKLGMNAQYVTKNAAPRAVFESKLTGTLKKTHISNMFTSSGSYIGCESNTFDALIVDEAHRLNAKSGIYKNLGENQIKEIIEAAKLSIFFIDEDQRVTFDDIGEIKELQNCAEQSGAKWMRMALKSQFRCNGSDGYLAFLDDALGIAETANKTTKDLDYDFQVVNSPNELRDRIFQKNEINNKSRLVAGYCWDWISKKDSSKMDIIIPEHNFTVRWNLASDGASWVIKKSVNEVGCIHTCQGLDMDYVGVIVGPDLIAREGKVLTDPSKRARTDKSLNGYKKMLKQDPLIAETKADLIIRNTYKTLMTRGIKGCYVYFVDKELEQYFKERINITS
jgi:uncharacterized protein